jgi:hypothetical protein
MRMSNEGNPVAAVTPVALQCTECPALLKFTTQNKLFCASLVLSDHSMMPEKPEHCMARRVHL